MSEMLGTPKAPGMSRSQAKKLALMAPLAAATLAFVASLTTTGGLPDLRVLLGAGVAAVMLSVFADLNPSLGGGFALLLLISATLVTGADAWQGVTKVLGMAGGAASKATDGAKAAGIVPANRGNASDPGRGGQGAGGGGGGSW